MFNVAFKNNTTGFYKASNLATNIRLDCRPHKCITSIFLFSVVNLYFLSTGFSFLKHLGKDELGSRYRLVGQEPADEDLLASEDDDEAARFKGRLEVVNDDQHNKHFGI